MKSSLSLSPLRSRRNRLAACTAAIFAASVAAPAAATVFVSICDDSGPGSLRAAVGAAGDPDTVDMTQLACSPISLTTGAIDITQNDLTINGPGPTALLITGKDSPNPDRIFNHTGTGTLGINSVSMAYGDLINNSGDAAGGCIYSQGTVSLFYANVDSCSANSTTTFGAARGGGIFTRGALVLKYGSLSNNSANGGVAGFAYGGGAVAYGNFTANLATISENYANGATDRLLGGGLLLEGNATIIASTISGNRSRKSVGGILQGYFASGYSSATLRIVNSTISGNSAAGIVGGIWSNVGTMQIYNSTIAFNTAGTENQGSLHEGPGLEAFALLDSVNLTLESSLLANNTYGNSPAIEDDFKETNDLGKVTLTGHNNLIRVSSESLPSDTIVSVCPLLGPLRNNGGPTPTRALLSTSPAIDKGNDNAVNPITMLPFPYDQRGAGFARVSGSFADIGAYEVQQDDILFDAGFDGCP